MAKISNKSKNSTTAPVPKVDAVKAKVSHKSKNCELCKCIEEELRDCKKCATVFCDNCGDKERNLCQDCLQFEEEEKFDLEEVDIS